MEARRIGVNCEVEPFLLIQWGMPLAVSYPARSFGISRSTHLNEAMKLCPHIKYTHVATYKIGESVPRYHPDPNRDSHKVSLLPYRNASRQIFSVLKSFRGVEVEKGGVDEAFMDLTAAAKDALNLLEGQFNGFLTEISAAITHERLPNVPLSLNGLGAHLWCPPPPIQPLSNPKNASDGPGGDGAQSNSTSDLCPSLGQATQNPSYSQADLQSPPPYSFCDDYSMSCADALSACGVDPPLIDTHEARESFCARAKQSKYFVIEKFLMSLNTALSITNVWEPAKHNNNDDSTAFLPSLHQTTQQLDLPPAVKIDEYQSKFDRVANEPLNSCLLLCAAAITKLIRGEVRRRLGFNCSAGVSCNKEISKCISAIHKPNQQTLLSPRHTLSYLTELPFQKLRGFGGKLGKFVQKAVFTFYRQFIMQRQFEFYKTITGSEGGAVQDESMTAIQENYQLLMSFITEAENGNRKRVATTGREGGGSGGSGSEDEDVSDEDAPGADKTNAGNTASSSGWGRGGQGRGRGGTNTVSDFTSIMVSRNDSAPVIAPKRTYLSFGSMLGAGDNSAHATASPSAAVTPTKGLPALNDKGPADVSSITAQTSSPAQDLLCDAPTKGPATPQKQAIENESTSLVTKQKPKPPFLLTCQAAWALPLSFFVFHLSGGAHTNGPSVPDQLHKTAHYIFDLLRGVGSETITKRTVAKSLMSQKVLTSRDDLKDQTMAKLQRWVDCLAAELMERYDQLLEDNNFAFRAKTLKFQFGAGGLRDWSDIINKQIPVPSQPLTAPMMSKCAMDLLLPYFIKHNRVGGDAQGHSPAKFDGSPTEGDNEPFKAINCVTMTISQFVAHDHGSHSGGTIGESVLGMLWNRSGDQGGGVKSERAITPEFGSNSDDCSSTDDEDVIFAGYYKGKAAQATAATSPGKSPTKGPQRKKRRAESKAETKKNDGVGNTVSEKNSTKLIPKKLPAKSISPLMQMFSTKRNETVTLPAAPVNAPSRSRLVTLSSDDDSIHIIE